MALNEKLNRYPGSKGGEAPEEKANQRLTRILMGGGALTTGLLGLSGCGLSSTEIRPTPTNKPEAQTTIGPTPTPEPEAQPTNLVFTPAKEETQNDPDFQKLNQGNISFFQEFKNRNPQNPWQLGETVALGVGNVDYALTTVVGPNGEPILGVISYLDKDGKLQSGFAIDFVTTIPSYDGERLFGGIYPLKPEISQFLLEGKTVTIDPEKDTQGPIFGFVLRQGKNWTDFSAAMQATTEAQRQGVFSSYVDKIYLQEPDGKTHLFSISKLSPSEQTQLVSYALPTATPASIKLTPTPKPSPTPTITPTPRPTETPTPIPQIKVGEIQLPDPRVTNPELFDLKKKEAPIPQFANALKNAGIKLSPEQIAQGITYVSTKEDGTPLVDKDGNPFVVAVYNLDSSLFPKKYRDLAGPVPLMIAKGGENGKWRWEQTTARVDDINVGVLFGGWFLRDPNYMGPKYMSIPQKYFSFAHDHSLFMQTGIEKGRHDLLRKNEKGELVYDFTIPDYTVSWAIKNKRPIYFSPLLGGNTSVNIPEFIKSINKREDFIKTIVNHIKKVVSHYNQKMIPSQSIVVINEYFGDPFTNDPNTKFWLLKAHQLGISDVEFMQLIFESAKEANPSARLVFNEYGYEIPGSYNYVDSKANKIYKLIQTCKSNGIPIDAVGFQLHLYGKDFSSPKKFEQLITNFRNQIQKYRELGVEVDITELDIRLDDMPSLSLENRLQLQALIYYKIIKTAREEGVKYITIWGVADHDSWLNKPEITGSDSLETRPLLFDKNSDPKLGYFLLLRALYF